MLTKEQKELAKVIEKYFGADAAYLDIDCFTLARRIIEAGWEKPERCKNCLFSRYFEESGTRKCRTMQGLYRTVEDGDFCSYGERREGE